MLSARDKLIVLQETTYEDFPLASIKQWIGELIEDHDKLEAALIITRGQWIHSVNAEQCLEALNFDKAEETT